MFKFISRIRSKLHTVGEGRPYRAILNRDGLGFWRERQLLTTGKQATINELLQELDQAIEEYSQTLKAREVA